MCTHVLEFIRRLPPSGSKGFEGLVKQQLEFLTGRRFYLAQSGAQSGRDMTSDRQQSNVMAVECKMYDETRTFDLSELQGKLAQVEISIPDLDLWILATTRSIPDQVISGLRCQVDERGIKIIGISPGDGNPSSIELICACEIDTTISFLNRYLNRNESRTLRKELNEIKNYTGYKESLDRLKKEFNTEEIGYDNTRRRLNELFIKHLRSAEESQATFLQILNVEDSSTRLIERRSAWNNLDGWLSAWPEIRKPFVLHGEEGDGKTWAVASWLSRSIKSHSDFPLVIFIPSKKAISDTPHTLLTNALVRQLGDFRQDFWANRLSRWLKKPSGKKPVILLI